MDSTQDCHSEHLQLTRARLRASPEYIANPTVLGLHHWIRHEHSFHVIENENPSVSFFTVLTQIVDIQRYLDPTALWDQGEHVNHDRELRTSCISWVCVAPKMADPDFGPALVNLNHFISIGRHGHVPVHSIFNPKGNPSPSFVASYRPFKSLDTFADAIDLYHIRNGQTIRGVEAFDMHGEFIHPGDYEIKLGGAIVSLRFSLSMSHQETGNLFTECFYADVESMRVIVPP